MKIKTLSWVLGLLLTLTVALNEVRAGEQFLFSVGGEMTSKWTNVSVRVDDGSGELVGLVVDHDFYAAREVLSGAKLRIDGVDNSRDVLKIRAPGLDTRTGGSLTLTYLHDGMSNSYRDYPMVLKRNATAAWKVYLPGQSKSISSLYMTKHTFFGKLIGIDAIRASFATSLAANNEDIALRKRKDELA
ncbi:MAG: hypothetical protein HY075_06950 [Deltaproteobacteria bacterium]|nr:hypothetical protein [Deltaproteobacteria bacterium]